MSKDKFSSIFRLGNSTWEYFRKKHYLLKKKKRVLSKLILVSENLTNGPALGDFYFLQKTENITVCWFLIKICLSRKNPLSKNNKLNPKFRAPKYCYKLFFKICCHWHIVASLKSTVHNLFLMDLVQISPHRKGYICHFSDIKVC